MVKKNSGKGTGNSTPIWEPEFFVELLQHPAESFRKLEAGASLLEGVKLFAVGFAVAAFLGALRMQQDPVVSLLAGTIGGIIASFIIVGIPYLAAVLIGGAEKFEQQYFLTSAFMLPILILGSAARLVPGIGKLLAALVFLYSVYLVTLVLMQVHKFSFLRALLVWLVPFLIAFVAVTTFLTAMTGVVLAEFALAN